MKLNQYQIEAIRSAAPELADKLAAGEAVTVEREVKRWEPRAGRYYIDGTGHIYTANSSDNYRLTGSERKTAEAAERLAHDQRIFNRLHAYREEFAPGYVVPEIGAETWCVIMRGGGVWKAEPVRNSQCPTEIYMPEDVASDLCRKLNSGEVVL